MDARFLKGVENTFKTACINYINVVDYLSISFIFAPIEQYTLVELKMLYDIEENKDSIHFSIESFYQYYGLYQTDYRKDDFEILLTDIKQYIENREYNSKTKLYYLLKLAFVISFYKRLEKRYKNTLITIKNYDEINSFFSNGVFRGQSNFEYRISPSVLRNNSGNIYLDDNYYYKLLCDAELEIKFNYFIKRGNINRYQKYAFMQHSCSFSPLVDFTKDIFIATSFALSNASNVNCFRNEDSSVFILNNYNEKLDVIVGKKEAREFIKDEFNLRIIDSKYFKLGKTYDLEKSDGSYYSLSCFTINGLLDELTPKIKVLDIPTNDRMLYQKGLFVCFYDCICLKDFVAYELDDSFVLIKVKIPKRNKRSILKNIYKNKREFDPEHLMDPYLIFKE